MAEAEGRTRSTTSSASCARSSAADKLDRAIEFLPEDEALNARASAGKGLTRPELAALSPMPR